MRRCFFVTVGVACVFASGAVSQEKAKDAAVSQVLADWKHRQGLFKSARWVITGTTEFKDAERPGGDPVLPRRTVLLLDFVGKRCRLETSEPAISGGQGSPFVFMTRAITQAFDGKILQLYADRELNQLPDDVTDLTQIINPTDRTPPFDAHLLPALYAHGLVSTVHSKARIDKFTPLHDPDDFEVRGRQNYSGRNCIVLRTDPKPGKRSLHDEFLIDLNEKSAIHRHVTLSGTTPTSRWDVAWKQTQYGWWPETWTDTWTRNGKVQRVHRLKVESFEANPAVGDADFTFPVKPGMTVAVVENPPPGSGLHPYLQASKTYRVSPSGTWQEIDAKGFTTKEGKQLAPERSRTWLWGAVAATACVLGAVGYTLYRRRSH